MPLLLLTAAEVERASDVAERRLTWVVYGLLGLAALIAIATVWFWRATRPDPAPDPDIAMRWINPADAAQRAPQAPERRPAARPAPVAASASPSAPVPPRRRPPDQAAIATLAPQRRPANGAPTTGGPAPAPPGPEDRGAR